MTAPEPAAPSAAIVGLLLAGGRSRRMGGGDKCLRLLAGEPVLARVVARARPQVAALVLNANGDPDRFTDYRLPVVADLVDGFAGPLAGVLTGMEWASQWARANAVDCPWIATFPTDAPFLPDDLVARLADSCRVQGAELACAASAGRTHPVIGLWPARLADELRRALVDQGIRKIDRWTERYKLAVVEWPSTPIDPFFNANSPEDLIAAERWLAG